MIFKIDALVYKLYGLNSEEIKIIDDSTNLAPSRISNSESLYSDILFPSGSR